MGKMKLGTKIALGFCLLIIIALALGGMAVYNMKSVEVDSTKLDQEFVPEVAVANNIERYSLLTMYAMRGYSFTEEAQYLKTGEKNLALVKKYLADAQTLADRAKNLAKLQGQVKEAAAKVAEYERLAKETVAKNQRLEELRGQMDEAAAQYMKNCNEFLAGQNQKMLKEIKSGATEEKLDERLEKITLVNDIIDLGNAARVGNFKSQALRDPPTMNAALENFPKMNPKFQQLREITREAEDIRRIEETEKAAEQYKTGMELFLKNWLEREELNKQRGVAADQVLEAAQTTAQAGMDHTAEIAEAAASSLGTSSTIMIVGLIVALIVGVFLAIFITRSITKPVNRIIEALASGADQVSSASGQVSSASQSLAEGASEQAAAIEETSSSLEEMSSMTKQNADNASQANSLMSEAKAIVDKAGVSMKEMTQSMDEISTAGQEIGKIIKTIDEIAFQTNLLALNAAVEAARAGEAGAGFAVVADEVRNLAQRAADAARNTADLIEGTITKINQGTELVKTTDEAFSEVAVSSTKVAELVGEIAAASSEQAQGIDQVNTAVSQMDKVTQTNAANAEESASASEELNAQAESMLEVVGDLMTLVGGAAAASQMQSMHQNQRKPKPKRQALPMSKEHRQPERNSSARVVKGDEIIPMDDDFNDF